MRFLHPEAATKRKLFRIGKLVLGGLLVVVGIAGLVLPFLQGFLLIFLGVSLLSCESKWVREKVNRLAKRFPRQTARVKSIKANLASRWRRGLA